MADHGLDHVGYGEDTCLRQDVPVTEALRVAGTVEALVVLANNLRHITLEPDGADDFGPCGGMLMDKLHLRIVEASRLGEDFCR